jgi:hypothetical protein
MALNITFSGAVIFKLGGSHVLKQYKHPHVDLLELLAKLNIKSVMALVNLWVDAGTTTHNQVIRT